ncbi:MAG TPA: cupin domain-containing protein [Alphaproteobacteria bacterium]
MAQAHAPGAPVAPDFLAAMEKVAIRPLWDRYHKILTTEPKSPDHAWLWRWNAMQKFIDRAANDVSMDDAERRVLMLVNPAFGEEVVTTTNLFAGIQILEPGEAARPHRHTASALRFVLEGTEGAVTVVNGQRCPMLTGDMILTPNWAWHEHLNDSPDRVVWLDGLDLPLSRHLGAIFAEGGGTNAFEHNLSALPDAAFSHGGVLPDDGGAPVPYSPMFRYPWKSVMAALDAAPMRPDGSRRVRYTNPMDGGPVMQTMDCYAHRIPRGLDTERRRSTANTVCLVVKGEGVSCIGDQVLEWKQNDVFTVPFWNWATHFAKTDAHLFMFTDREVLRTTGLLREEVAR